MSVWSVLLAGAAIIPLTAGTLLYLHHMDLSLWPFGRPITTLAEIVLRYEMIALVCLAYVILRSLPGWLRYRLLARADARAIEEAIARKRWEEAAVRLHRYCLLVSAIWRRIPPRAVVWDNLVRPWLPRNRRVYVYFYADPPPLPQKVTASFAPEVFPPNQPSLWSAILLVPVAMMLYLIILDIARSGQWPQLLFVNVILLIVILVLYGGYFLMALLGRSRYYRFAPGVIQLIKFDLSRRRPQIETFDLHRVQLVIDLVGDSAVVTLHTAGDRQVCLRLGGGQEVSDALLRAALSTAPRPPLPEEGLLD
ncbi:MAG: hypothetical protein GXY44_12745 [Phycisphaerales bacterium]|nr:hypothetical protein [Phycisphaerales bacterium]